MKRLKIAILISILLVGGIVLVRLWENLRERRASEAMEKVPEGSAGDATQVLRTVHLAEDKHGQKTWELEAKSVRQYEEQNIMVLEDVKVTFYTKEGRILYLTSKQGKIYQDSKNVDLIGDVVLTTNDGYRLKTQSAFYRHSENIVNTSDPVEIDGEQIHMTGIGMLANVEAKTFRILSQVKTHLKGKKNV